MSCKQCDVLAADHDAEVKRLKTGEEMLIGVNKILGDEVTRLTNLAYSKDALLLSSQDEVTRLKATNAEMARRNGNLQERLAAADALLRDAPTGQGAYMLEWRRKREVHLSQSPASEAKFCGPECTWPEHGECIKRLQASQPAPDVTAQTVTDPIAALRAEVEQLQLDAIRDRYTQQKVCEALQYGVERLDSLMVIEGQRTDRLESRVAALEPKAGWQIVYGPMASRPVPEPPLVTHTSEALRKLSSSVHQAITEAIDETRDMAERMDNRNLPQLDHCYVRPPLGVDDFCCFSVAFNTPCGLPESRHKMRDE